MSSSSVYAVHKGAAPGVYGTWDECFAQTAGHKGAVYKKFASMSDALQFVESGTSTASSPPKKQKKKPLLYRDDDDGGDAFPPHAEMANVVHVHTDGSCFDNGSGGMDADGGCGAFFGDKCPLNISVPLSENMRPHTNQLAELYAIAKLLEAVLTVGTGSAGPFHAAAAAASEDQRRRHYLYIHTDSMYSLNCIFTWYKTWEKNGFRLKSTGQPVKHAALIQSIKLQIAACEQAIPGLVIVFKHERGHAGIYGNEQADSLARAGATAARQARLEKNQQ